MASNYLYNFCAFNRAAVALRTQYAVAILKVEIKTKGGQVCLQCF